MAQPARRLNCVKSQGKKFHPKYRGFELELARALPTAIDMEAAQSPIWDQGNSGSCSGYSTKSHLEFLQLKELHANTPPGQAPLEWARNQLTPISAFFIYWNERVIEGSTGTDAGATTLLDACTSSQQKGVTTELLWPSTTGNLLISPTQAAFEDALKHKLPDYYALDQDLNEFKRCLSSGFGFSFGVEVFSSFMSDDAAATGIIPFPSGSDSFMGGHALFCMGYDDATGLFKFKNSWGTSWGASGYGFLPYEYMLDADLANDFFTMRLKPTSQNLLVAA
jgi:Papain family cysteine protease